MQFRDYSFRGTTQSLCPDCLTLVPAKIIARGPRVYFRKRCPTHGTRDDFVCSDVAWYDRMEYSLPGKIPARFGVEPRRGCPYDCGLCSDHEQHTCIGVLEITDACNLTCPLCYAGSAPGRAHLSVSQCQRAIDHLVRCEGRPEVLQLSGGEPTIHPQFSEVLKYACDAPIDIVMINTNGLRIARDDRLLDELAGRRHRLQIYLQLDGLDETSHRQLRGEPLLETKLRAVDRLGEAGLPTTLVCTLQPGVNLSQIGPLVRFGLARPGIGGISFQPASYAGRYVLPEQLESRITFPDVIRAVAEQTGGLFVEHDFMPLPCAHPNGHSLTYAYREGDQCAPLARFIDVARHLDLLAGGITFDRAKARQLIEALLARGGCGDGSCGPPLAQLEAPASGDGASPAVPAALADSFFRRALAGDLGSADVFRITTTTFMDVYNFDVRQLIKSCVHHVLPSGHLIPFSAYNVLYRDGHVPLPPLTDDVDAPFPLAHGPR